MRSTRSQPKALIIRLSSIGDVLFATPVAKALRELHPEGYLAWLVEEKSKEVVEGNPFLDEVIVWPRMSWRKEKAETGWFRFLARHLGFFWRLRRRGFDLVLDLQGMVRSALVAWLSGARRRVGFQDAREGAQLLYNKWVVTRPSAAHVTHEYMLAAALAGATTDNPLMSIIFTEQDRATAHRLLGEAVNCTQPEVPISDSQVSFAAFCPSASRAHKLWPAERFAQVADWASDSLGVIPVFFGAKADVPYIERVRDGCRCATVSLAGMTSLKEAAALLSESRVVIGADTALTHMGVACGRPVVALFGPAGVNYEPRGPLHEAVRADCDCSPCWTRVECRENYRCMQDIEVERVIAAVRRVLLAAERQGG